MLFRSLYVTLPGRPPTIGALHPITQTIAECVETAESLQLLQEYGIDFAQGYHLGRPEPVEEIGAPRSPQALPE